MAADVETWFVFNGIVSAEPIGIREFRALALLFLRLTA